MSALVKKVVVNACYGGFSLSPEATLWLWQRGAKGIEATHVDEYWPPERRAEEDSKYWLLGYNHALAKWRKYLAQPDREKRPPLFLTVFSPDEQYVLNSRDVERHDPLLVQCVEEMGEKANGACAELVVKEIPYGVDYVVEEYDGMEWIAERHRTW